MNPYHPREKISKSVAQLFIDDYKKRNPKHKIRFDTITQVFYINYKEGYEVLDYNTLEMRLSNRGRKIPEVKKEKTTLSRKYRRKKKNA